MTNKQLRLLIVGTGMVVGWSIANYLVHSPTLRAVLITGLTIFLALLWSIRFKFNPNQEDKP